MRSVLFPRRPIQIIIVTAVLILVTLNLVFFLGVRDPHQRSVLTDIIVVIDNALPTAALFYAARRSARFSRIQGLAWGFLAIAQLANTLGDLTWAILEAGLGLSPYPSLADVGYLLYYPLFMIGILLMVRRPPSSQRWVKRGLEMGIIILAAGLGIWNLLIGPLVASGNASQVSLIEQALSMAYPIGDLLLFWAILVLLYSDADRKNNIGYQFLTLGLICQVAADIIFSYQTLKGTYMSGSLLDLAWVLGYLLTASAGIWQGDRARKAAPEPAHEEGAPGPFRRLMNVLPYGFLVGAYLLLVRRYSYPLPMGFSPLAAGVGAVIAMVLLRQYITLHENDKLNRQQKEAMESAHQQAVELENANQALQAEISERQRMQQQLAFEAMHDWLTGLPNRFLLMERLGQALALTRQNPKYSFAVLFMDLDQFKVINDSLGHPVGDQLLISLARRLNTCLRNEDTLSRFGGDEFIFLLDKSGEDEVLLVSNRIMEILKPPFILDGHEVFTTASIGIVSNGQNYEHPEDILRDADIAMYRAKSLGKARSEIFNRDLREQAFHRLELERNLRQAVEKQEFCLDYQPVFTLATQQMIGFEALIRWNHPLRGQLMPDDFIHVAEETGLILPIGAWVLDTACAWLKQNRQANPHLPALRIHVNISAQQLASPHFAEQIRQVLDTHGLEGRVLRLDVDEHTLVSSFPTSGTLFSWLRVMGVGLQINNFGTGYSSLGYLQRFPIQAIKIDRSFIHELDSSSQGLDILRAMLVMGQEMGIEIIAEGIERESQARILKELNCLYGQGDYFSAPLDSEAASQFLQVEAVSVTTP